MPGTTASNGKDANTDTAADPSPSFARRKLAAHFIDDVTNISISPNGACRLHLCTWSTDENGNPLRIDSEIIMTRTSLHRLAEALPQALSRAESAASPAGQGKQRDGGVNR